MQENKVLMELSDEELENVVGGDTVVVTTIAQLISSILQGQSFGGGEDD